MRANKTDSRLTMETIMI